MTMIRNTLVRILLVIGSLLLVIGVILMAWSMWLKPDPNVIKVSLTDGETRPIKFEGLGLVPGQSCEYTIKLNADIEGTCDLTFDFDETEEKTLKHYARVKIVANETTLYDELLATAFESEGIVIPVDFDKKSNTELTVVYYMPIEVGNEAKNAAAVFELKLTATNEEENKT